MNLSKQNQKKIDRIKLDISLYKEYKDIIEDPVKLKKYKSITSVIKELEKKLYIKEQLEKLKTKKTDQRVILGDALENLKSLEEETIDCIITDPPYGIDFKHSWTSQNNIKNDGKEYMDNYLPQVFKELSRVLKKDGHIYVFSSFKNYPFFATVFENYFELKNCIVWEKNNSSLCDFDKRYGFSHEFIMYGIRKDSDNSRLLNHTEGKMTKDVLKFNRVSNPDHSCEKPVPLLEKLITTSTLPKQMILDPFSGSGSTLIAAKNLNRNFIGIEYDEKWWRLIQEKLQNG